MASDERKNVEEPEVASLLDSQITTSRVNRRSFLTRALGASTLAVGAALTTACGDEADTCDADTGDIVENVDTGAGADSGDPCDSDT